MVPTEHSPPLGALELRLEREGAAEELAELRRLRAAVQAGEAHARTIAEVTRSLLQSEKTYRLVFSHELDPMSLFDPATGALLDVNDAWLALYGYDREEALSMKVTDVSAEPARTREAIEALPHGATMRVSVRWHRAKDGTVFPVELTAGKLMLGEREVCYAVMRDITQGENAERALARSEASFRALIESMPDGVLVHRHGAIVYMSPSLRRMLGYGPDEDLRGRQAIELVHPDDRPKVLERVVEIFSSGKPAPPLEERFLRKDGTTVLVEVAGLVTVFDGEQATLAIARDITDRKEMEARLVMTDRLASLGRLAASVGHELNNPLAYILGNVALMERELAEAGGLPEALATRFREHVAMIKEGAGRMRDIVHDMKTLARGDGQGDERLSIDLVGILDVCANMAEPEIRVRARFVKHLEGRPFVRGSEARLGQVFLNLLVNAAQAIAPGAPHENEVHLAARSEADRVLVEVSDTGCGIAPEDADRIFEPFFTTKPGQGTGLGLAISHQIVSSLGGSITVASRPGGGSVFRVVLPSAGEG